jgi:hypothetical protein
MFKFPVDENVVEFPQSLKRNVKRIISHLKPRNLEKGWEI